MANEPNAPKITQKTADSVSAMSREELLDKRVTSPEAPPEKVLLTMELLRGEVPDPYAALFVSEAYMADRTTMSPEELESFRALLTLLARGPLTKAALADVVGGSLCSTFAASRNSFRANSS